MASAVLASRNESTWAQSGGGFMGKIPYSNPYLNPNPNPNTNPDSNSKPKPKKKQKLQAINGRHADVSPAVTQTASDDAYSFNQRTGETSSPDGFNHGGYVSFNISSYSRSELNELRRRLLSDLQRIRNLNDRIVSGELQPRSHGGARLSGKNKKLTGSKRPLPFVSSKDQKRLGQLLENGNVGVNADGSANESLMKMCRQLLTKLMKHKHNWIFNKPVDAEELGLHDYHQIIKRPMDLGTVKSNLVKNLYASPSDFAADVRLTFNNAMLYNPKTDEVHVLADQLLDRFENLFRPIQEKIDGGRKAVLGGTVGAELQSCSWSHVPTPDPERPKKPNTSPLPPISKQPERVQSHSSASTPSNPPPLNPPKGHSPAHPSSPVRASAIKPVGLKGAVGKQPKPRAKDPNKREMSMEEKQKLGIGLQSLPQEKMPQLVQIIRKRNDHLAQEGDEIELDIEALDTETLWELDRFVTNWKKMVSKTKRQALMANNSAPTSAPTSAEVDELPLIEKPDMAKKPKKGDAGDEDVDICDDTPRPSFPPVEIEKDEGGHDHANASSSCSSSSSSSSGSSSSSDSDSGSSSGSDSDADDAQS